MTNSAIPGVIQGIFISLAVSKEINFHQEVWRHITFQVKEEIKFIDGNKHEYLMVYYLLAHNCKAHTV